MISASHCTGSHDRSEAIFKVHYTGQHASFYMARIFPLFALFTVLMLLYLDEDSRRSIFSRHPSTYKPFSWLEFSCLLAFMMAPVLDLILTLTRVGPGKMALSVSPEGITGAVVHRTRLLTWDDIADVIKDGKFLVVRRQPRSLLQKLFASRGLGNINLPAHHLDRDVQSILAAVRHFSPSGYGAGSVR